MGEGEQLEDRTASDKRTPQISGDETCIEVGRISTQRFRQPDSLGPSWLGD